VWVVPFDQLVVVVPRISVQQLPLLSLPSAR
jgi:hypothetical protein